MKKITIKHQTKGTGVLMLAEDGKYDMELNGRKAPSNNYYTRDQVEKIIAKARSEGSEVTIED